VDVSIGEECDPGPGKNGDDKDCTSSCKWNICGDGHVNATLAPDGRPKEDCDVDASSASYKAECPYTRDGTTPCALCSMCRTVTRPARYCGDGVLDGADAEACDDDRSFSCGTCGTPGSGDASCQVVPPADATGSLTVLTADVASLKGVTFQLQSSVFVDATVFELVDGGTVGGKRVQVDISGATSASAVAADIRDVVNGQSSLGIAAAHAGGSATVSLSNSASAGVNGNAGIVVSDATKLRGTAMASGRGCALGQQCQVNQDCVSGLSCTAGFCQ
jgi:hypothetical protein